MTRMILILMLLVLNIQAKDVYATFSVEAEKSANLAFSSSGIVDEVAVDVTTLVKKGDLLAKLQNGDLKAQLDIAQTALKYAKADYNRQVKVKNIVDKTANKVRNSFQKKFKGMEILGPAWCYRERLRGKYRMQIVFKSLKETDPNGRKLHQYLINNILNNYGLSQNTDQVNNVSHKSDNIEKQGSLEEYIINKDCIIGNKKDGLFLRANHLASSTVTVLVKE